MNIALLNTRIHFQKQTLSTDEVGNHINTWSDAFSCYATVSGEGGSEGYKAAQTTEHTGCAFTVRYSKKTSAVTEGTYRIVWQDMIYNIVSVDHLSNKREALKFRCVKEAR